MIKNSAGSNKSCLANKKGLQAQSFFIILFSGYRAAAFVGAAFVAPDLFVVAVDWEDAAATFAAVVPVALFVVAVAAVLGPWVVVVVVVVVAAAVGAAFVAAFLLEGPGGSQAGSPFGAFAAVFVPGLSVVFFYPLSPGFSG